jgi:hypothetical protein
VASPREALTRAWTEHPAICVAGSIFLLGALLPYIDGLRLR